jgi:hypothetical protein
MGRRKLDQIEADNAKFLAMEQCELLGHAEHTIAGVMQTTCLRCGESL